MLDKIMICIGWAATGYIVGVTISKLEVKLREYFRRKYEY